MLISIVLLVIILLGIYMSNLANYSPFNRSYQFIHLQNSAYHLRNKQKAKPRVNTNIKPRSQHQHPQHPTQAIKWSFSGTGSSKQRCQSARIQHSWQEQAGIQLKKPHRVIHKHEVFERAKSARISHQNIKLVRKIIKTDCQILKNSAAEDQFKLHQKYRSLRRRYQENGERLTTPILNLTQLNPALAHYKSSSEHKASRLSSARQELSQQDRLYDNLPLEWLE